MAYDSTRHVTVLTVRMPPSAHFGAAASQPAMLALIFHPGIETWVVVFCLWLMWRAGKFAFKRLVLNYMPPERIKEK